MKQPQAEYVGIRQILARRERCNNAGQQFVEDPGVHNNGQSSERLVEKNRWRGGSDKRENCWYNKPSTNLTKGKKCGLRTVEAPIFAEGIQEDACNATVIRTLR